MDSPFVKDNDLREDLEENINMMPSEYKEDYQYIWVAFFPSGSLAQFDEQGQEHTWGEAREKDPEKLFWVPIDGRRSSYGIEAENIRPFRRVAREMATTSGHDSTTRFYCLADGDPDSSENILFICPDGKIKRSHNYQHNPVQDFEGYG